MELLSDELRDYLQHYCDAEDSLLKHIDRETNLKVSMPRMLSGHYQGRVLSMISKMMNPSAILEVGTFTGYATLCFAEGLSDNGKIHTIDVNVELEDMVRSNFSRSPYQDKIVYHLGDASQIIPGLDQVFDIVFIDADKKNNGLYYELVMDKLRTGGIIIVDNVLWSGKVLDKKMDQNTAVITTFNEMVLSDQRVEKLILPVRDGLFIARKR